MNHQLLNKLLGAPLRLRVKNQLGFKMVKWINAIEFDDDVRPIGKGEGGFAEDDEYFDERANIEFQECTPSHIARAAVRRMG